MNLTLIYLVLLSSVWEISPNETSWYGNMIYDLGSGAVETMFPDLEVYQPKQKSHVVILVESFTYNDDQVLFLIPYDHSGLNL